MHFEHQTHNTHRSRSCSYHQYANVRPKPNPLSRKACEETPRHSCHELASDVAHNKAFIYFPYSHYQPPFYTLCLADFSPQVKSSQIRGVDLEQTEGSFTPRVN